MANVGLTYSLTARAERRRALARTDAVWARQRASLAFAAGELSDRIDNILGQRFLDAYGPGSPHKDEAILSTLFRFSQYFGWSEIIRRATRVPDSRHAADARFLEQLQGEVGRTFATDRYGPGPFMVWRESQRALGELMIVQEGEIVDTIGVAGFWADFSTFRPWLHRMERLMKEKPPAAWPKQERERLIDVQAKLKALRAALDDDGDGA